jgi:hypothetical protein
LKKQDYKKNIAKSLSQNVKDSSVFWKNVKTLIGDKKKSTCNNISKNDWLHHFKTVHSSEADVMGDSDPVCNSMQENHEVDCLNAIITKDEVVESIKGLNCGKASGIDNILSEMLKAGNDAIIDFLVDLFNCVFEKGVYPTGWSKAIIIPLYKKGNPDMPDNYRGISLISVICKCYTSILNNRLYKWLEDNEKLVENQAGFRKDYSTTDNIFTLYAVVQKCLNKKGRKLYAAFIDFKKAFDSVNHDLLLDAIASEGVSGTFFRALKAMYESLISCVRVNNEFTDFFDCPCGVRQGCGLSPTLFSLFINRLAKHINETGVHGVQMLPTFLELFILLFADDVVLLSTTPGGLQAQLNSLKVCCDKLKLNVNFDKTKIIVFRKGGFLGKREKWFYDGKRIEVVNSYSYLGFTFSSMLSVKAGTQNLVCKAKKAAYLICRAFSKCKEMSAEIFFKLFDAKVQSIILYSSEVWGLYKLDTIEKVHMIVCKRFLGVPLRTPNKMIYSELNRYPLYINSFVRSIKYWFRLLHMDQSRLPKQAYLMLQLEDARGKRCWASQIREILCACGFQYVWMNQGVGQINVFLKVFKQRLCDIFYQEWSATITTKDRYATYKMIKREFCASNYLLDVDIYCFRVAITQIRLGVIPLNNNMHRYSDNQQNKLCPFCKTCYEDEYHFLLQCPLYAILRKRYILCEKLFNSVSNILCCEQRHLSRNVAKYVFYAMKERRVFLEIDND